MRLMQRETPRHNLNTGPTGLAIICAGSARIAQQVLQPPNTQPQPSTLHSAQSLSELHIAKTQP